MLLAQHLELAAMLFGGSAGSQNTSVKTSIIVDTYQKLALPERQGVWFLVQCTESVQKSP